MKLKAEGFSELAVKSLTVLVQEADTVYIFKSRLFLIEFVV